jgi:hypothetical protein
MTQQDKCPKCGAYVGIPGLCRACFETEEGNILRRQLRQREDLLIDVTSAYASGAAIQARDSKYDELLSRVAAMLPERYAKEVSNG